MMEEEQKSLEKNEIATESTENTLPPLSETTWFPFDTNNPVCYLLLAAISGFIAAGPAVIIAHDRGAEVFAGALMLFSSFLAVALPHVLSKFSFPARIERCFPHGVATMLLIGQTLAAYLFFMNTAFYGSTAIVAAVLMAISLFGRIAMIWFLKYRHAWLYTLVTLLAFYWIFNLFQPEVMDLPLGAFLQKVEWKNGISGGGMAIFFLYKPVLFVLAATVACAWGFRKWEDRRGAAMATAMIAELAAWTAFLATVQFLTFFPG